VNASVCLLVIGDLGSAGEMSLSTLPKINSSRICVCSNPSGKKWLTSHAPDEVKALLCFHDTISDDFKFTHLQKKTEYSEYRTSDFRMLTLLKWDLLIDSMQSHPETKAVAFSDLDVYWINDPGIHVARLESSKSLMFVQDDSSELRPAWCCTGVMFWKNTKESLVKLNELHDFHLEQISTGNLQDDEDTFNQVTSNNPGFMDFQRLPREEFLVGRHFNKLIFSAKRFGVVYCFHANYLTGLNRKFDSLNAVSRHLEFGKFPWKELIKFASIPIYRRLKNRFLRELSKNE
jgi:hypothetical protein